MSLHNNKPRVPRVPSLRPSFNEVNRGVVRETNLNARKKCESREGKLELCRVSIDSPSIGML
jgi:hypothetical protein